MSYCKPDSCIIFPTLTGKQTNHIETSAAAVFCEPAPSAVQLPLALESCPLQQPFLPLYEALASLAATIYFIEAWNLLNSISNIFQECFIAQFRIPPPFLELAEIKMKLQWRHGTNTTSNCGLHKACLHANKAKLQTEVQRSHHGRSDKASLKDVIYMLYTWHPCSTDKWREFCWYQHPSQIHPLQGIKVTKTCF